MGVTELSTVSLEVEFIRTSEVVPTVQVIIDQLDRLAFAENADEDVTEWSGPDWMVLGRYEGEIVTQLGLLEREIQVGAGTLLVGGVGGVATLPARQRRGFSSTLMQAAAGFLKNEMEVPFGLLVCAEETQPFYARLGWKTVSNRLLFTQEGISQPMHTPVMILSLAVKPWPQGEIDLCGLPW